jgi:hypothetical protein
LICLNVGRTLACMIGERRELLASAFLGNRAEI